MRGADVTDEVLFGFESDGAVGAGGLGELHGVCGGVGGDRLICVGRAVEESGGEKRFCLALCNEVVGWLLHGGSSRRAGESGVTGCALKAAVLLSGGRWCEDLRAGHYPGSWMQWTRARGEGGRDGAMAGAYN